MKQGMQATVLSNKMQNTAVVEIVRKKAHPLYRKLMTRSKTYKVDTTDFTVKAGDAVYIEPTRQVSKDKYFKIVKIITSGKKEEKA